MLNTPNIYNFFTENIKGNFKYNLDLKYFLGQN